MKTTIDHWERTALRDLFVGQTLNVVDHDTAVLSNGKRVTFVGNQGCGGCGGGWYHLEELNNIDHIITNVEVKEEETDNWGGKTYRIFVFADNTKINLATFEGDDGSGYYGTGFWLEIEDA